MSDGIPAVPPEGRDDDEKEIEPEQKRDAISTEVEDRDRPEDEPVDRPDLESVLDPRD